jgi:hypothetical protein
MERSIPYRLTNRFECNGVEYALLADAAQEAEFVHAETGRPVQVSALADEPECWAKGDVVYTSQGAQ